MIRLIVIAGFGLVVATSALGMTPAPLLQPDSFITKVVAGCGIGRTMVNGKCETRMEKRHERRQGRRTGQPAAAPPAGAAPAGGAQPQ
jgi:hypothetical protein